MGAERGRYQGGEAAASQSPQNAPIHSGHAPCPLWGEGRGPLWAQWEEPGSRGIALLALCTWAKSCSFWASLSSSTKWV